MVTAFTVLTASVLIDNHIYNAAVFGDLSLKAPLDDPNWVYDGQYSLKGTDIDRLAERGEIAVSANETIQFSEITRSGGALTLSFTAGSPASGDYIELPLSWYPHYETTIDGQAAENEPGDNNVIRVYTEGRSAGTIRVKWKAPVLYRVMECISVLAAVCYPLDRKYHFTRRLLRKRGQADA